MFKKIKQIAATLALVLAVGTPVMVPVTAHAIVNNAITSGLCTGLNTAANGSSSDAGDTCAGDQSDANKSLDSIIKTIINILSIIVGFVSVVMIIIGGFKYITSGGESSNVTGAKNTIMYALIGLVIVALAQVIVRFVLTKATA